MLIVSDKEGTNTDDVEEGSTSPNVDNDTSTIYLRLRNSREKLWRTGDHSDVKVHVGDRLFNCHKTILVKASCYFEAMFSSGMREAISGEITFHDMDPDVMEHILEHIYTHKDTVADSNVMPVLEAALLLQIKSLCEKCETFLLSQWTVESALELWRFAIERNCTEMKKQALKLILDNFDQLVRCNKFLEELTTAEMIQIIKDNSLIVSSEEIVVEAVLRWAELGKDTERLEHVIQYVRLAHVSVETLVSLKTKLRGQDAQGKLEEAWNYKTLPARRQEMYTKTAEFRDCYPFEEVLIIIANKGLPSRGTDYIWAYSFRQKKWFTLPRPPFEVGHCLAACCHGNDIYLTGGCSFFLSGRVLKYSGVTNKWMTGTGAINESRCDFTVAALTDALYAFGGEQPCDYGHDWDDQPQRILSSVERYDIVTDRWEVCGNLVKPTKHCTVEVLDSDVFLFGPFFDKLIINSDDFGTALRACYMYNTVTQACTLIREFWEMAIYHRTLRVGKSVYMILQSGQIAQFSEDARENIAELKQIENLDCYCFGAVCHANNILVFGGIVPPDEGADRQRTMSKKIFCFNTVTGEVSNYPTSLPEAVKIHSSFVIAIDKKFLS